MKHMRQTDHFLITEAWRKVERFEAEVRSGRLLADYRRARTGLWRQRAARLLVTLARRLEPKPNPLPNEPCRDCC